MNWGTPHILWILLALPVWAWINLRVLRARRRRLAAWVDEKAHPFLLPGRNPAAAPRRILLRTAALACLVLALARPQWGFHWEEITRRGLDLLVVLDTSRSMTAADIKPSRLQQAKWGIHDLLRNLRGDRVGLVPFAGSSLLQCPLTTDYAAFAMTLDDLYCGIIPRGGTAIAQALRTAIDAFPDDTAADRCILLVTDGEDHEGDPLSLLPELKEKNIRLYAIGIGTLEGEMIPADPSSGGAYFKDRKGQIVKTTLHEDVLQQLAVSTGGTYVRSAAGDTGLERVFRESIDKLKRSEQENRTAKINEERFQWPLLLSLLLLLLESLTPDRTTPGGARPSRPRSVQVPLVLLVLTVPFVLLSASPARAEDTTPTPARNPRKAFKEGLSFLASSNYPAAYDAFIEASQNAAAYDLPPGPALHNAAIAKAKEGELRRAAELLDKVPPVSEDILQLADDDYNKGLLRFQEAEKLINPEPETEPDPQADPKKLLNEALQCFENAIGYVPDNIDYKKAYERTIALQQQLPPPPESNSSDNQEQSSDENQDQSDDQQQSQSQDQQQQEGDQQEQQQQSQSQDSQQSQESPSSPQSQETPQSPSQDSPEPQPSEQMTPEEAALLLDAMRAREQSQRDQLKPLFGRPIPVENDW